MSLIHDSLRKLETKQVKNAASGFNSPEGSYLNNKSSSVKKLWIALIIVMGIVLIYYAYMMLNRYQKQNEILINDIKLMKSNSVVINSQVQSIAKPFEKVIVQPPADIKKPQLIKIVASQERQKEVTELNKKLLNAETNSLKVAVVLAQPLISEIPKNNRVQSPTNSKKMATPTTIHATQKPKTNKRTYRKKVKNHKLTVKQTRQLVNNLQMQMELKNSDEVSHLLKKLAQSSGVESLVFLRMKAYWSNINDDKATAVVIYKKILFQKPYDIQAGTNLALIEAKNDQKSRALKRLELLKNKYPSNKVIIDYFNRVEAN